jgi:TonB family protein
MDPAARHRARLDWRKIMKIVHPVAGFVLVICLAASLPAAEEPAAPAATSSPATPDAVPIELFQAPKPLKIRSLDYPRSQSQVGNEGWVELGFMIDPKGKPYEITVVDSSGIEAFEEEALNAARNWVFEPARLGNEPIDAGFGFKVTFAMTQPASGASQEFVRAYKPLVKAIEAGDRARADELLAQLEAKNLYEDAFKHVARFQYHRKWGTEREQLADLKRAVAGEKAPRYLSKELFVGVLDAMLTLETTAQDFGHALKTWERLRPLASKDLATKWQPAIDQILALQSSDRPFKMAAHIEKGTSWNGQLLRNRFHINVKTGQVSEIKLRCEKTYVFFRYEPELEYTVDARSGNCGIEVVGEHDTEFDLVQL